ncbi:hypothetical protein B0T25DRAFT_223687 [Lasiosphaeria hispida]|uniref:Archaemetzincin-2 n=1 Tax=Lasiosphaeria hispida TaxID=260671 RepID=A0AAJ0HJR0_9PEZI|nr:hypothetical protein B0T25DRAFT_223687 [Lasiosphaeria hispida]
MASSLSTCTHVDLQTDVSSHAEEAGFPRPSLAKRKAAATPSGRVTKSKSCLAEDVAWAHTFPGPLVLPDDALALDPADPPQSLRSWICEKERNPITPARKAIYVAPTPSIAASVSFMKPWTTPSRPLGSPANLQVQPPKAADILVYLAAFYHPLPVKLLRGKVAFVPWSEGSGTSSAKKPGFVGLQLGSPSVTRIRTRACPDGAFARQLNLNDVLDAEIEILPADAYALVLVTDHDLYEDEEDDFCCGRAFGGSRVSVVSTARYHPALDGDDVDRGHMWPGSHCAEYIGRVLGQAADGGGGQKTGKELRVRDTPLGAAVKAALAAPAPEKDLGGLWFSRVARTVSHELGHCHCLDHCSYYACVMQSTAGMVEDVRQPPYLCAVCLSKISKAMVPVTKDIGEEQIVLDRYKALLKFCEGWLRVAMFAGYHAWLEKRILALQPEGPEIIEISD